MKEKFFPQNENKFRKTIKIPKTQEEIDAAKMVEDENKRKVQEMIDKANDERGTDFKLEDGGDK